MLVLKIKVEEANKAEPTRIRVINKTAEHLIRIKIKTGRAKDKEMNKEWVNKANKDRTKDATRVRANKEVEKADRTRSVTMKDRARDVTKKDRARDKKPRAINPARINKLAAWALRV